jgi:hypothetical protein
LNRLLPTRFPSMVRRVLLRGLYRVYGNMFVPRHKVRLASHVRHGNVGEVGVVHPCHRSVEIRKMEGGLDGDMTGPRTN